HGDLVGGGSPVVGFALKHVVRGRCWPGMSARASRSFPAIWGPGRLASDRGELTARRRPRRSTFRSGSWPARIGPRRGVRGFLEWATWVFEPGPGREVARGMRMGRDGPELAAPGARCGGCSGGRKKLEPPRY